MGMELQGKVTNNAQQDFPFPVDTKIKYIGDLLWELEDGTVLLKYGMEFVINFSHDDWVGIYMPGYPDDGSEVGIGWCTYQDVRSNVCIYLHNAGDWEILAG